MTPPLPDIDSLLRESEWLRRLTKRLLGDGPDADDLAQETLERALRHSRTASDRASSPRGWLGTIARNLRREKGRQEARRAAREREAAREESEGVAVDTEAIDRALLRRTLIDEVLALPEPERSPLVLHYFEGLTHGEIAARIGIEEATSRKRVSRAIARLRGTMGERPGGLRSLAPLTLPLSTLDPTSLTATVALMTIQAKVALALTAAALVALFALPPLLREGERDGSTGSTTGPHDPALLAPPSPRTLGKDHAGFGDSGKPEPRRPAGEPAKEWAPTHRVIGRVVDNRRVPVAGATVALTWPPAAPRANGEPALPREATSAADGTFELVTALSDQWEAHGHYLSTAAHGRGLAAVAFQAYPLPKTGHVHSVDVGALVLQDACSLEIVAAGGPASVRVELGHQRRRYGTLSTDGNGHLFLPHLPPGPVYATANSPAGEARGLAFVPDQSRIELVPEPTGSLDVTVLDRGTGLPVPGAKLLVQEPRSIPASLPGPAGRVGFGEYGMRERRADLTQRSDANGKARILGLAAGVDFSLKVTAKGYGSPGRDVPFDSSTGALEVELPPIDLRTVRWSLEDGECPVPADGTQVRCTLHPGSSRGAPAPGSAAIVGGELVVQGVVGRAVLQATTEDGRVAWLWVDAGTATGHGTSFRRGRRITVNLEDPSGAPVVGAYIEARSQGNNLLGTSEPSRGDGHTTIEGLYGGLVVVQAVAPKGSPLSSQTVGSLDIEAGDAEVTVVLRPSNIRRVRVRFLSGNRPMLPSQFVFYGLPKPEVLEEHPAEGEILIGLEGAKPNRDLQLSFQSPHHAPEVIRFRFQRDDDVPELEIRLVQGAALRVDVTPMEGVRTDLALEKLTETAGHGPTWERGLVDHMMSRANGPGGSYVFPRVTAGTWRVVHIPTGQPSDTIEVAEGQDTARVEFDLSGYAWVTGTVEVPDPFDLPHVRLMVDTGATGPGGNGAGRRAPHGVSLEGRHFKVLVPGDREVTIRPWHPWLSPSSSAGSLRVLGGREGAVLRLEHQHGLRIPLPDLASSAHPGRHRSVRVGRYPAGPPVGAPIEWRHTPVVDGVLRCAMPEGTWTVLVDPGETFAPLELRSIPVRGIVDLPKANLGNDSSLILNLQAPEGTDPPRMWVFARSLDGKELWRFLDSNGESKVILQGLAAGRYSVEFRPIGGTAPRQQVEVTVDGKEDASIEVAPW